MKKNDKEMNIKHEKEMIKVSTSNPVVSLTTNSHNVIE